MRGCIRPLAIAWIRRPDATVGVSPGFQPTALGTLIGGSRYCVGSGSHGFGPYCRIGSLPLSLHAPKAPATRISADIVPARRVIRPLTAEARVRARAHAAPLPSSRECPRRVAAP